MEESIADFERAVQLDSRLQPYMWQLGLSLYYAGTPEALRQGAQQFRLVKPQDCAVSSLKFGLEPPGGLGHVLTLTVAVTGSPAQHAHSSHRWHASASLGCRDDVAVNPNDTEEAIWAFLCEAKLEGPEAARAKFLQVNCAPLAPC